MKDIKFTMGNWEKDFVYVNSDRFPFEPRFFQEDDCIVNGKNSMMDDGFDYTTIMTKKKYGKGTKIRLTCSFEKFGAPLITLTDKIIKNEEGNLRHSSCYEIVVWEEGLNVWHIFEENNKIKWVQLLWLKFHLESGVKHDLFVEIMDECVKVVLHGNEVSLRIEDLPEKVYLGITGCENINRFYNLKIDSPFDKTH